MFFYVCLLAVGLSLIYFIMNACPNGIFHKYTGWKKGNEALFDSMSNRVTKSHLKYKICKQCEKVVKKYD